jgi:hypothetical protein
VVWPTFQAAGAELLVVSGAVDAGVSALARTRTTVVHLHVEPDELRARVAARGRGEGVRLAGDELIGRSTAELDAVVDAALQREPRLRNHPDVDVVVDTTGRTSADVAVDILTSIEARQGSLLRGRRVQQ